MTFMLKLKFREYTESISISRGHSYIVCCCIFTTAGIRLQQEAKCESFHATEVHVSGSDIKTLLSVISTKKGSDVKSS
jgi:hypothetical protein